MIDVTVSSYEYTIEIGVGEVLGSKDIDLGISGGYLICWVPLQAFSNVSIRINGGVIFEEETIPGAGSHEAWKQFVIPESDTSTKARITIEAVDTAGYDIRVVFRYSNVRTLPDRDLGVV